MRSGKQVYILLSGYDVQEETQGEEFEFEVEVM